MSEVWVADASPIIVLAKAGYLKLLTELPTELILPEPVVAEILAGPANDPACLALELGWGLRLGPAAIPNGVQRMIGKKREKSRGTPALIRERTGLQARPWPTNHCAT